MQSLMNNPEPELRSPGGAPSSGGMLGTVLSVVSLLAVGVLAFLLFQANKRIGVLEASIGDVARKNDARARAHDDGLATLKSETRTIAERTGLTESELEKTAKSAQELREAQKKGQKNLESLGGEVGKVKEDVAAQKAALDEVNSKLTSAIGDLGQQSGLIARNADELGALKRAGMRDYVEFDIKKSKNANLVGPVAIRLKDADVKRHKFNMILVVDDVEIEKKDKTLLEPVQFYRKGSRQLQEIVVYTVAKDRIVGYLSMPKAAEAAPSAQ